MGAPFAIHHETVLVLHAAADPAGNGDLIFDDVDVIKAALALPCSLPAQLVYALGPGYDVSLAASLERTPRQFRTVRDIIELPYLNLAMEEANLFERDTISTVDIFGALIRDEQSAGHHALEGAGINLTAWRDVQNEFMNDRVNVLTHDKLAEITAHLSKLHEGTMLFHRDGRMTTAEVIRVALASDPKLLAYVLNSPYATEAVHEYLSNWAHLFAQNVGQCPSVFDLQMLMRNQGSIPHHVWECPRCTAAISQAQGY